MVTDPQKDKLDFSGNNISTLELRFYFRNTVIMDISQSHLQNISEEALESFERIDRIYLHDNLLTTLPRAVTTINFSFTSLSLYNNPLDCSCDQVWLKDWLTTIRDRLENSDVSLSPVRPRRVRG